MGLVQKLVSNFKIYRKPGEVITEDQFTWTFGTISFLVGVVVGIVAVYVNLNSNYKPADERRIEGIWLFGSMAVLALYAVYMLIPYMKSDTRTIGKKILTAVVGAALIGGGIFLGARLVMFAVLGIFALVIFRVFGHTFFSTLGSAGSTASKWGGFIIDDQTVTLPDGTPANPYAGSPDLVQDPYGNLHKRNATGGFDPVKKE